ncbi:MAG: fold metallo-hydrolase [Firmicutes bacterium]|nr:fold metallo-hydrolase [Bacillota bacterium]
MKKILLLLMSMMLLTSVTWASGAKQPNIKASEQDFSVITVGSGAPGLLPSRAESMTAIQYKGNYFVVDCGARTTANLLADGISFNKISLLLFTHLHADHSTDFPDLLIYRASFGGKELSIVGPPNTTQLYEFFRQFYRDDILYRGMVYNEETSVGTLKGVKVRELTGSNQFTFEGVNIETAEMVHTMYDLAYKFSANGKTIVVSGDTTYNENLINLAKDVDVLVMEGIGLSEVTTKAVSPNAVNSNNYQQHKIDGETPKPLTKFAGNFTVESHAGFTELLEIAKKTNVKKLVLTHIHPKVKVDDAFIQEVQQRFKAAGYNGEVILATDGLEINP